MLIELLREQVLAVLQPHLHAVVTLQDEVLPLLHR